MTDQTKTFADAAEESRKGLCVAGWYFSRRINGRFELDHWADCELSGYGIAHFEGVLFWRGEIGDVAGRIVPPPVTKYRDEE